MVSKSVLKKAKNDLLESLTAINSDFMKAKRKKKLTLEERIRILCLVDWKSPIDMVEDKKKYPYVRRKMREMGLKGILEKKTEIQANNTTKNFYRTNLRKFLKDNGRGYPRPLFKGSNDEKKARQEAFLSMKKSLDMANIKL